MEEEQQEDHEFVIHEFLFNLKFKHMRQEQ